MPAFGCSAVPSPKKILKKSSSGFAPAIAAAVVATTAGGWPGSPSGLRRVATNDIAPAAAELSTSTPVCSQDSVLAPNLAAGMTARDSEAGGRPASANTLPGSAVTETAAEGDEDVVLAPLRLPGRRPAFALSEEVSDLDTEEDGPVLFEPAEPADPVVSANAMGIDAIAEPTPSATASAPTKPT